MSDAKGKPTVELGKIKKFIQLCSGFVGCNILSPDFRINILTVVVTSAVVTYYIFVTMTVIKLFHKDWKILLEASCMATTVLQGATKLIVVLVKRSSILEFQAFLEQLYKDYEGRGPDYVKALNESCIRITKTLKVIFVAFFIPSTLIVLTPLWMIMLTNRRYLIMQFHFPGIDISTTTGYFTTYGLHAGFMFFGTFGLYAGDLLCILYMMQSFLFVDIFKLKIRDLNDLFEVSDEKPDQKASFMILRDIIKWHQDYMSFTKMINSTFYYIVAVMITTSGISIVFSLFIILTGDWPGAYPYLLVTSYCLYVYCILGTKIETSNEQFTEEIYNIYWYKLPTSQQQVIKLMLLRSQQPNTVYVAGVLPLSVTTGLQITKTIYSIFMFMIQFFVE